MDSSPLTDTASPSHADAPQPKAHAPGFLKLVEDARPRVREISAEEAHQMQLHQGVTLVDVREDAEWRAGHAWAAWHIGRGVLERDIEARAPDLSTRLICYCGGGFRSVLAADTLQRMGYTHVSSMAGGWRSWEAAELPATATADPMLPSPREMLGGLVWLPRLLEKMRRDEAGIWMGIEPAAGEFDRMTLDFLCVEWGALQEAAEVYPNNADVFECMRRELGPAWPADHAIRSFSERLTNRAPEEEERRAWFEERVSQLPLTGRRAQSYFDLIDLEENRLESLQQK